MSGLRKGKVAVRFFVMPNASAEHVRLALDLLLAQDRIIKDDAAVGLDVVQGWSGPSHLNDRDLEPARCIEDGILRLFYVTAERKVPASVVNQKMAEAIQLRVNSGQSRPGRDERKRMREEIIAKLKPAQAVSRKMVEIWWDFTNNLAVASNPSANAATVLEGLLSRDLAAVHGRALAIVPSSGAVLTDALRVQLGLKDGDGQSWPVAGPLSLSNDERAVRIGGTTASKKSATRSCIVEDGMGVDSCVVMAERDGFPIEMTLDASGGIRGLHVPASCETLADRMRFFRAVKEWMLVAFYKNQDEAAG